jgi:hypothetical protein
VDSKGKVFRFHLLGKDPRTGKACEGRMVNEIKEQDHHTLRFYDKDAQGKDVLIFEIT